MNRLIATQIHTKQMICAVLSTSPKYTATPKFMVGAKNCIIPMVVNGNRRAAIAKHSNGNTVSGPDSDKIAANPSFSAVTNATPFHSGMSAYGYKPKFAAPR